MKNSEHRAKLDREVLMQRLQTLRKDLALTPIAERFAVQVRIDQLQSELEQQAGDKSGHSADGGGAHSL